MGYNERTERSFMKIVPEIVFIFVFLLTLITASESPAVEERKPAEHFNEANALYRDNQFAGALQIYEELIRNGIVNPDLYYNAANAAHRIGATGKAILNLERALKLAPSDKEVCANLAFLNSIKKDQEPENTNAVLAFLSSRYNAINVNTAALWSGVTFALSMVLATGALFGKGWKQLTLYAATILCGVIFITSTAVLIQKLHYTSTVVEAIVMDEEANAYSGPGIENTHIFTIHEGTKVVIERTQKSWNLIRLKSGAGGWIQADLVEQIY